MSNVTKDLVAEYISESMKLENTLGKIGKLKKNAVIDAVVQHLFNIDQEANMVAIFCNDAYYNDGDTVGDRTDLVFDISSLDEYTSVRALHALPITNEASLKYLLLEADDVTVEDLFGCYGKHNFIKMFVDKCSDIPDESKESVYDTILNEYSDAEWDVSYDDYGACFTVSVGDYSVDFDYNNSKRPEKLIFKTKELENIVHRILSKFGCLDTLIIALKYDDGTIQTVTEPLTNY